MLSLKVFVKDSKIEGRGLYARERIVAGEVTWNADPKTKVVTRDEVDQWSEDEKNKFMEHAWQFASDKWYYDDPNSDNCKSCFISLFSKNDNQL